MGYKGDSLTDVIDKLERVSMRTGHRMAERMQERGEHNITINTPIETSMLRSSYNKSPIRYRQTSSLGYTSVRWSAFAWEGTVFTEVEYAPFVEIGTGLWGPKRKKYKIAPRKPGGVLAFTPYERTAKGGVILDVQGKPARGDQLITVRFVMHPGSPGQHMFQIGTTLTEAEKEHWSLEPLRLWKAQVESNVIL